MDRQYFEYVVSGFEADRYYSRKRALPHWVAVVVVGVQMLFESGLGLVCKIKGHDLVEDDSYSAVGSGRVTVSCKRCGYSHTGYW